MLVAPLAGARIEISNDQEQVEYDPVAPLAGARIEIPVRLTISDHIVSLPSRERGLKFGNIASLPSAMRRSPRGSAD